MCSCHNLLFILKAIYAWNCLTVENFHLKHNFSYIGFNLFILREKLPRFEYLTHVPKFQSVYIKEDERVFNFQ